jgi:2-amino-4-hydroxy-6-hydroxymethyldihydropteridine diphosphokinase
MSPQELMGSAAAELGRILDRARLSPLYETAPLYVADQPPFLNAALSGFFKTKKSGPAAARLLLHEVQAVETRYGRNRAAERRWRERPLDIDILLFGNEIINEPELIVPHPRLGERAFALQPLLDLLPEASEPKTGTAYRRILETLNSQEIKLLPWTTLLVQNVLNV